ncbi:MAG: hypothetical protein COA99_02765 [Moraxellaceae bacterium]|nr:MAG: hypothetical protein COA99_02765 [Moraxellaceae bacterium]
MSNIYTKSNVFFSGHGIWKPSYGYVQVPRGVTIHFYTLFAKMFRDGMAEKILKGEPTEIERTHEEFCQVPNMRLTPLGSFGTQRDARWLNKDYWGQNSMVMGLREGEEMFLKEFFLDCKREMLQGDHLVIRWLSCSQLVGFHVAGGKGYGVNATDFSHDPERPSRYRTRMCNHLYERIGKFEQWL